MKLLFTVLLVLFVHAGFAEARPEFTCTSTPGIALEVKLPDFFYKAFSAKLSQGEKVLDLAWQQGAEPGQPTYGNADTTIIENITDGVLAIYVQRLNAAGGNMEFFAVPTTVRLEGDAPRTAKFTARANILFYPEFIERELLLECSGTL